MSAQFTTNQTFVELGSGIIFSNLSTGTISSWSWDFNNDGTEDSTESSPSHTYTTPGVYTVSLTVTGPSGSDTRTRENYITVVDGTAPVSNFTAGPTFGAVPLDVSFHNQSVGDITSWSWDFNGDGTPDSTEENPLYQYATDGSYDVSLTVTGPGGSATMTRQDYIKVGDDPAGSILAVSPVSRAVSPESGTVTFAVANAGIGSLNWTARSNSGWLTITNGSNGVDDGTISVSYDENTGSARTGRITVEALGAYVSPQTIQVNQSSTFGPSLTVTAPVDGDVWALGSTQNIAWSASSPFGIDEIRLFYQYSGSSLPIEEMSGNPGSYSWTLPSSSTYLSETARIRVVAIDGNGVHTEAFSDYFSVQDGAGPPTPWSGPEQLTSKVDLGPYTSQDNTNAAVAVDGNGDVHLVYRYVKDEFEPVTPRVYTQKLYYLKKVSGAWLSPVEIFSLTKTSVDNNLPGYFFSNLRIVTDSNNKPHIAWVYDGPLVSPGCSGYNQQEIYYITHNGVAWESAINVSNNSTRSHAVDIAMATDDTLHFVWSDGRTYSVSDCSSTGTATLYHRSRNAAGQWSSITPLIGAEVFGSYPAIAPGPGSTVHLVHTSEDAMAYTFWDGSAWSTPYQIGISGYSYLYKDVAVANDGIVHVVYDEWNTSTSTRHIRYRMADTSGWHEAETVSQANDGSEKIPEIALNSFGNPQIVWYEDTSPFDRLLYRQKTSGQWSSIIQLNTTATRPYYVDKNSVSIAASLNDVLHITWQSYFNGGHEVYYTYADIGDDQVDPEIAVDEPAAGDALEAGTVVAIRWKAIDNTGVAGINLEYSIDGGITRTPIASSAENSGSLAWTVPDIDSANVQIIATATDYSGNQGTTASGTFTIVPLQDELVAQFSADVTSGPAELQVTFTDESSGPVASRLWVFGDGSTSTEQNPTHIYNVPGTYSVGLTITRNGASKTMTRSNYIEVTSGIMQPMLVASPAFVEAASTEGNCAWFTIQNHGSGTMAWTAVANQDWLTISSGASGIDNGTIIVDCTANLSASRSGTITVTAEGALNNPLVLEIQQDSRYPPYFGDIDSDGDVDLIDVILVLQVLSGANPEGITKNADINGDGIVSMPEAIFILKMASGI